MDALQGQGRVPTLARCNQCSPATETQKASRALTWPSLGVQPTAPMEQNQRQPHLITGCMMVRLHMPIFENGEAA